MLDVDPVEVPLKPEFPCANVIADGPSAQDVQLTDLLPGPTIAINCAIKMRETLPITIWASVDTPDNLWEPMQPWIDDELLIFTTPNNIGSWQVKIDILRIFTIDTSPYLEDALVAAGIDLKGRTIRDANNAKLIMSSIICVFAWLLKMGCPHVRVFGADMKGQNSPFHPYCPWIPEDDKASALRWFGERALFAESIRNFRKEHMRLERWKR